MTIAAKELYLSTSIFGYNSILGYEKSTIATRVLVLVHMNVLSTNCSTSYCTVIALNQYLSDAHVAKDTIIANHSIHTNKLLYLCG